MQHSATNRIPAKTSNVAEIAEGHSTELADSRKDLVKDTSSGRLSQPSEQYSSCNDPEANGIAEGPQRRVADSRWRLIEAADSGRLSSVYKIEQSIPREKPRHENEPRKIPTTGVDK